MNLNNITLDTNNLDAAHLFYIRLLGLPVLAHSDTHLSLLISNTRLTFQKMDKVIAPSHVTINVLRASLPVLMKGYGDWHHLVAQTPQKKSSRRLKPQLGRSHFYDPMGNLIELIPQVQLAIERTILDLGVVQQLEEHQVLLYA